MAIYSFNHDTFGKTTNRAGAAGENAAYNARDEQTRQHDEPSPAAANAAYNAREEVTYAIRSHVIPPSPAEAEAWFRQQELADRKNARMSDRFIGALPRELTPDQCIEAVQSFCERVTGNRVPWHFALHLELDKKNEPDWNPHTHIIIRDRDIETGKRALYTSAGAKERAQLAAKGVHFWSTQKLREAWQDDMNNALERAGHEVRIDHRSYKDRGIDLEPQIHEGPKARMMADKGIEFESRDHIQGDKTVVYTMLDAGSRLSQNARIVAENDAREKAAGATRAAAFHDALVPRTRDERAARDLREVQSVTRQEMRKEQQKDRDALYELHRAQRAEHQACGKQLYADAREKAFQTVKELSADAWKAARHKKDFQQRRDTLQSLKLLQKADYAELSKDNIAAARVEKDKTYQALQKQQDKQRADLRAVHREESATLARQHVAERLSLQESSRAAQLQSQTQRANAKLAGNQGMAAQQAAAHQTMRLRQRASQTKRATGAVPIPQNPAEAARAYAARAQTERAQVAKLRGRLTAERQFNHLQGTRKPALDRRREASRSPRTPAEAAKLARRQAQHNQSDSAIPAGRSMTDAERANASPQAKERHDRQQRSAKERQHDATGSQQQRGGKGKARTGGGRGR